jgi:uncharacterized protein
MQQQRPAWSSPTVDWVIKISRFCNLRCRYCYEYPHLGDHTRMSLAHIEAMFRRIAEHYQSSDKRMDFVWHGGEPLLIEPAYYREIAVLEREIFTPVGLAYANNVQTNLTRLSPPILELIRGFFNGMSVSIDFFGDQRVNIGGKPIEPLVKRNMARLKNEGIVFGCISVLSRENVEHVEEIYRYVEEHGYSLRFLPIYRTGFPGQQDHLALSASEIVMAFERLADVWLTSERAIRVRPLEDYLTHVIGKLTLGCASQPVYDKSEDEVVYVVATDGSLYSTADAYNEALCHGNLFTTSIAEMQRGAVYRRAVEQSRQRMAATCERCAYYGACSGFIMGEATPEERHLDHDGALVCGIAEPMHRYLERRLVASGLGDRSAATTAAPRPR